MKKNYIGAAITAAVIAGALTLPVGVAVANPCANSASPWCVNSSLPREMAPLSPAPDDACTELARYGSGGDLHQGEGLTASVPQSVVSAAHAAGCPVPENLPGLAY